jgi:hypothetical protein
LIDFEATEETHKAAIDLDAQITGDEPDAAHAAMPGRVPEKQQPPAQQYRPARDMTDNGDKEFDEQFAVDLDTLLPPVETEKVSPHEPTPQPPPPPAPAPQTTDRKMDLPLEGNLSEYPVPVLFQQGLRHELTGAFEFSNGTVTKKIFWKRGKIITGTSNDIDERLDNFLFRKHLITDIQRDELRQTPPELLGSPNDLLKRRFLTIEQIFKVVKEQVESIIKELFSWQDGTFQFREDSQVPREMVPMDISPPAIVLSALRELTSWNHLDNLLPPDGALIRPPEKSRIEIAGLNLSPLELRILNLLVEPFPVEEIIRRVNADPVQTRRTLYSMEITGLIVRAG